LLRPMSVITVRIDKKTKKRMSQKRDVNWSEVVRTAIAQKIDGEEERNLGMAVLLNERSTTTPDAGYDSTEAIREWRKSIRWR